MDDEKTGDILSVVEDESIFTAVKSFEIFKKIFENHILNQGQVLLRNSVGNQFFSKAFSINSENCLECSPPVSRSGTCLPSYINQNVLVDFFTGEERYHFQALSSINAKNLENLILVLPIPKQIFQRQRRTEFRYVLPRGYQSEFIMKDSFGRSFSGSIIDVSNMGVSIMWHKKLPDLDNEVLITGHLKLGQEQGFEIKGIICCLNSTHNSMRVGMEFTEVDAESLAKLSEQIARLHEFMYKTA
jgi:c-di-GMP-binding flagellar brake protein YcgR